MIIKNLTRKNNSGQLIRYILRYILSDEKQLTKSKNASRPFLIRHNMRSRSLDGYIREFQSNELNRIHKRSDQTALHHTILSWSDKDAKHITDEMLMDMAKQYIKLRGENNLYLGTVHWDRSHIHIHLAVSATQLNGKASRITKQRFADLKKLLTQHQKEKYPELCHSLPVHGKKVQSLQSKEFKMPFIQDDRFSKKELLATLMDNMKAEVKSVDEFISALQFKGYEPYFRGAGKVLSGVKHEGIKYRFKTLGVDVQQMGIDYQNLTNEEKEMGEMRQLRRRELMKENSRSRDKNCTSSNDYSLKEIPLNSEHRGYGEVSPYSAFRREELSFTR